MRTKKTTSRNPTPPRFRKDPATVGLLDTAYKLQKAGDFQHAELLYHQVLSAEPGNPFASCSLGTMAMNRGNFASAVPWLRQALATGYTEETVYTHLGIALQALGRVDEAMEVYQVALKQDPKNPRYYSNIAVALAMSGDPEGGLREVQRALSLDPAFVPAYVNAGACLQSLGRIPEAIQMLEKALSLDPKHTEAEKTLGELRRLLAAK